MDYLAGDEFYGDDITSGFCEPDDMDFELSMLEEEKKRNDGMRAYLASLTPDEYNDWLDEQTEEANLRIDAQGARS